MTIEPEFTFPKVCQTCNARLYGICGALRSPELLKLSKYTNQRFVKKGDVIAFDDDEISEFVNIVSGTVKLSKILADGRQQIVGLQFAPEFVGRPFAQTTKITAEAASDLEICILPKKAVEDMLGDSPQFERRLFDQTLVQLDEAREWMVTLGRKTAVEKIASFLLLLNTHLGRSIPGKPDARSFELPLSRGDIADFLGLTIETVSRQITKLRKSGVIEVTHNNNIEVPNIPRLERVAGD